jgi:hypothetical protein
MRKRPLIAGASLCLVVPLFGRQQEAHALIVGSHDPVDRRSPIIP